MSWNVEIALIICLTTIVFFWFKKCWMEQRKVFSLAAKFEKPPGYSYYPLIGHIHHYRTSQAYIAVARSFTKPFGVIFHGPISIFYLNDPELLEDCLTNDKCLNKPNIFDAMKHIEHSIYLSKDNAWKQKRKLLSPGFKQSILNFYTEKFAKYDLQLAHQLEGKVGSVFNMIDLVIKPTCHKYFDTALGLHFGKQRNEYCDVILESFKMSEMDLFNARSFKFINDLLGKTSESQKRIDIITRITKEVVAERLQIINKKTEDALVKDDENEVVIFIDHILQCITAGTYDENHLVSELIGFIFASTDTTSLTLSFICVCLGLYQDIQEKVYEEIVEVTGDRPFHYTDYQRFEYIQMVIKETMRLFPMGPVLNRQASDNVKIGEYIFPKDSIFHLNVINVHRSPIHFPNPSKFEPERFRPNSEAVKNRHRFAYLPFSGGKRSCIAERFGMLSLVSSIVTLFKKFRFETTYISIDDIKMETKYATGAVDGYPIRIYLRK